MAAVDGYSAEARHDVLKRVAVEPPRLFDPGFKPKFLLEAAGSGLLRDPSPRHVPRAVATAAAFSLRAPSPRGDVESSALAISGLRGCGDAAAVLAGPRAVASSAREVSRQSVRPPPPPPPLPFDKCATRASRLAKAAADTADSRGITAERFDRAADPLALIAEPRFTGHSSLSFGEAVQLTTHVAGANGREVALSLSPAGAGGLVDTEISEALRASGRRPDQYYAVTGAALPRSDDGLARPGARSAWELHRANPMDGFPHDGLVYYGQPLHVGQRPAHRDADEILLSFEPPPREGGSDVSYLVLARKALFGHPDPAGETRKTFDTVMMFVQWHGCGVSSTSPAVPEGFVPFDLSEPALLVALGPTQYIHEPRFLQLEQPGVLGGHGRTFRTVAEGCAREHGLEVVTKPAAQTCWNVSRLMLPQQSIAACEEIRARAHAGLSRALLGRALPIPSSVAGSQTAAWESPFVRWQALRRALLPRLSDRGMVGLALFRKAMIARGDPVIRSKDLTKVIPPPNAHDVTRPLEVCAVPVADISMLLVTDYGVKVDDSDLAMMARTFGNAEGAIAVDLFVDGLRGPVAPGRHRCLERLYEQLQRDQGIDANECPDIRWVEEKLWDAKPPELKYKPEKITSPHELLRGLPLLRAHTRITRHAFVRWMLDLTYLKSDYSSFVDLVGDMWGTHIVLHNTDREARLWNMMRT